jgi:hypothetical protein
MKTLTSFDQNKIKIVCDKLCDRIKDVLDHFNLEYKTNPKFISMRCPIHDGDNSGAVNIYHTGESYRGNWKCRTHNCEQIFKASIIGFIRGVISNQKYNWSTKGDKTCTFQEALDFATEFLDISLKDIKVNKEEKEKNLFIHNVKLLKNQQHSDNILLTKDKIHKTLDIPSKYFMERQFPFSPEILTKYSVGDCKSINKSMSGRAVVPIFDIDHKYMIGCTGRSLFEKCSECKCFHDPATFCPTDEFRWEHSKWKHSWQFKSELHLYNYWFAKKHIIESGKVIIVESPGNVWRLEENGIHNSVAIFGTNFTDRQKTILDMSGAMTIITIMDNDIPGQQAAQVIRDKCSKTYNIKNIIVSKNDIAEMSSQEIEKEIKVYL